LERVIKDGFTAEEVTAAKAGWLQWQNVNRSGDGALAGMLGARDFDDVTMTWDADLEKKVSALTPQQILDALRRHLDLTALSIIKAGDFKKAANSK
jgi:zinc protease